MFRGGVFILLSVVIIVSLVFAFGCTGQQAGAGAEPIVMGYIGQTASPGVKPVMDAMKVACDEINAAGGIQGRPIKWVIEDSKGETSLAVAALQRLVMGSHALAVFVEGRTEICLAVKPKSLELYKQYPHLLIFQGPMGRELTLEIVDDYENQKYIFRDWDPEDGHYCSIPAYFGVWKEVVGAKKVGWMWEDLAWTTVWRNGVEGLPKWEDYAKQLYGLETVYSKPFKARTGMYLPTLEAIAAAQPDIVFCCSSWFTDTEVLAKQWSTSSAKNIPFCFYGGTSHTYDFWELTGGAALGCMGAFYEKEEPFSPNTIPFLQKMDRLGIPVQVNVAIGYGDIYLLQKAIGLAGSTNIDTLIPKLEGCYLNDIGILGLHGIEDTRIAPFFHSRIMANPKNCFEPSPMYKSDMSKWANPVGQFQGKGNVVLLSTGTNSTEWPPRYKGDNAHPELYKSPAALRAAAGIK